MEVVTKLGSDKEEKKKNVKDRQTIKYNLLL